MSHPAVDERDLLPLYGAESLDGPWTPQPANPIVRGMGRARLPGAMFELEDAPSRASQYGGRRQGRGLELDRIVAPDERAHVEETVARLAPTPGDGWPGLHSIPGASGFTFVDWLRRRPQAGAGAGRVPAPPLVPGIRRGRRGESGALR